MKTLLAFLILGSLVAVPIACSPSDGAAEAADTDLNVPCTCGDAYSDMQGCAHPACLDGSGNPDNPECVCGPLSMDGRDK